MLWSLRASTLVDIVGYFFLSLASRYPRLGVLHMSTKSCLQWGLQSQRLELPTLRKNEKTAHELQLVIDYFHKCPSIWPINSQNILNHPRRCASSWNSHWIIFEGTTTKYQVYCDPSNCMSIKHGEHKHLWMRTVINGSACMIWHKICLTNSILEVKQYTWEMRTVIWGNRH